MLSTLSQLRGNLDHDLHRQIAALAKQVSALQGAVSSRGGHAVDGAWDSTADLYDDFRDRLAGAMPHIRKGARTVERSARDHPATAAVVGLVVVGLVVAFMSRR